MIERICERILTVLFIGVVVIFLLRNDTLKSVGMLFDFLCQKEHYLATSVTINDIESTYCDDFWKRDKLIDFNSALVSSVGNKELYSKNNIYVSSDNYIMSPSNYTTTDFEVEQVTSFCDFLKENNIKFLYVNEPTKYISDDEFKKEFAVESYSNRNADLFLESLSQAEIDYIDLRQLIVDENLNVKDMFYRTDHHWTVPTGLWASKHIAEALNEKYGYDIDLSLYDSNNFEKKKYTNCWLGEQGRKVGKSAVGLDDFEEVKPKYDTDFWFKGGTFFETNGSQSAMQEHKGTFEDFINEDLYSQKRDVYNDLSWHYSYNQLNVVNNHVENGKVLLIGDSYNQVVEPFIALGVHEADCIILRDYDDSFSIRQYILDNNYDTVVMLYAQFMIGAHDEEFSANKRMFELER